MEDFKHATARAITALKCLGIENNVDLYVMDIPPVGTVLRKGFMGISSFMLTTKLREELIALQDDAVRAMEAQIIRNLGDTMLENPEDYGLI